ncbi:hypothetical protein OQH60_07515 [Campylobacter sp. MIT 21-1685]|uniref:hypothetical protein n=1 Tax=unclassified Campylobacter TaxID=2593542 RepID=UPI00224A4CD4|nr:MULTISPECIES: hypothetical protein [unclassified Campylobacter]MCX2683706.1 hypothetical protein [Campylobacter sp. MIT 21-1684]MCX2751991.1 hypothetical protein [Campylobacter sp. MIT 21-1682]MCX2808190.1 hypothetical protein [Campylobacter sp. MIT 21-1685]
MKSLRGKEAKEKFIKEYENIKVLAYAVLLNGCTKINQCGGELTDKYYQFSAIHKDTKKKEIFYLGYDCGEQLMQILSIPKDSIKLFNPFSQVVDELNIKSNNTNTNKQVQPTKLANELFEIINIMYMGLNLRKTDILDEIIINLREKIGENPRAHNFASVNTILNRYGKTISAILEELQQNNQPFKRFDFTQSREYFREYLKKKNKENENINF